jgi:N4 gp56-like protein|nr:MAG TPA: major capsid protein [Caudoviricetes sp.]
MAIIYDKGTQANPSSIDKGGAPSRQISVEHYWRKALYEAMQEMYFGQLADTVTMPYNQGKKISLYHYIPLLNDANVNDQGINATGATITDGNLYGSSKDIGAIPAKLPVLSEEGGRVNRVGYSRKVIEGTFQNLGFFSEYSEDSMNFDTDAELMMHINREMLNGAMKITEDMLQIDLLNAAGVVMYTGSATSNATVTDEVTYADLVHLGITLDQNRTPKQSTIITGTRNIDTRTIPNARIMYIGSELIPLVMSMKDFHNNPAFIGVEKYGAAVTPLKGEIGAVAGFRLVVVPDMMRWAGAGAASTDPAWHGNNTNKDVLPMLVVGDKSFTTVGWNWKGSPSSTSKQDHINSIKFKLMHRKPDMNPQDPFGKIGAMSIQWWYGFLALRPERIAVIKTAAKR